MMCVCCLFFTFTNGKLTFFKFLIALELIFLLGTQISAGQPQHPPHPSLNYEVYRTYLCQYKVANFEIYKSSKMATFRIISKTRNPTLLQTTPFYCANNHFQNCITIRNFPRHYGDTFS